MNARVGKGKDNGNENRHLLLEYCAGHMNNKKPIQVKRATK